MKNTEGHLSFIMIGYVAYFVSPVVFWFFLAHELESGAFPVEADSIGIPMAGFMMLWFAGWLVMILGVGAFAIWRRLTK